ncbi:MAG: tRNA uridine-5-carboxymethylaminomethyl(34) synthesis GTPase MnmE [Pseudomonadota bacterium]
MDDGATIYAVATPPGRSGVAVIRVSGPEALALLRSLTGRTILPPRRALLIRLVHDGAPIDDALVIAFPAPQSFTGEDVVEFQTHGSPAVLAALTRALSDLGARPAGPGAFTRRAFANGKMDLTQVEGLADLIDAETDGQRRQALRLQEGALARRVEAWTETLVTALAQLEASIDFSDEGDVADAGDLLEPGRAQLDKLAQEMASLLDAAPKAERMREGVRIVVAGPPNAGKSSLLNTLAEREVAIVTPVPGTTRDTLDVALDLAGVPVLLTDTAGLRETDDTVERLGIDRAEARMRDADLILWLGADPPSLDADPPIWWIGTKADLTPPPPDARYATSTVSGEGIAALTEAISAFAQTAAGAGEPGLVTRERQRLMIVEAEASLIRARQAPSPELCAEDLRAALHALHRLTGRFDVETVLDALFAGFCIGK